MSIRLLKAVHAMTHPSAKIDRPVAADGTTTSRAEGIPPLAADEPPRGAAARMATLAAED